MPTPTGQLLTRTSYAGDGVTTTWNFTFASGYIDKAHVRAYTVNALGARTELAITLASFTGPYQLTITPPVPAGSSLTIYRATPKDSPLVDFADGGALTEASLDTVARQAIFCAAEGADSVTIDIPPVLEAAAQAANQANQAAGFAASAATSASSANTYRGASATGAALSEAAANTCQAIASSLSAGFGFTSTSYDFGSVTDPVHYFNLNLGAL